VGSGPEGEGTHSCVRCGKVFQHHSALLHHLETRHPSMEQGIMATTNAMAHGDESLVDMVLMGEKNGEPPPPPPPPTSFFKHENKNGVMEKLVAQEAASQQKFQREISAVMLETAAVCRPSSSDASSSVVFRLENSPAGVTSSAVLVGALSQLSVREDGAHLSFLVRMEEEAEETTAPLGGIPVVVATDFSVVLSEEDVVCVVGQLRLAKNRTEPPYVCVSRYSGSITVLK